MEQKKQSLNLKDSLNQGQNNFTDSKLMSAMISESETWLKLDWVKEKLKDRWKKIPTTNFEPFTLS